MASTSAAAVTHGTRRLAGPHKLPHLLSILPGSGRQAIVRPVNDPENHLYLITRSKLKFTSVIPVEPAPEDDAKVAGAKVGKIEKIQEKNTQASNPVDGGIVNAHGKAWGMFFRNGRFTPHKIKTRDAEARIRPGKTAWVAIDPTTLPPATLQAIQDHKTAAAAHQQQKAEILAERAVKQEIKNTEGAKAREELSRKLYERRVEEQKVEVIY